MRGTMLGASAEIVIADAVTRGVTDSHADEAWPLLRAAALDPVAPPAGRGDRSDVEPWQEATFQLTSEPTRWGR